MTRAAGTCIGPYEITSALGEGGMGEVYRATDTRLRRQVAIKVLSGSFAQDPERVARFRREAQVLAALNHPNIAAIYDLEEAGGEVALAMELVDGEDLAQRLARRGAVSVDETITLAAQIATGLEAAHERGIVHRDLKPANIKVAPDGSAKILDFGLARAWDEIDGGASGVDPARSPTMTRHRTEAGLILGTAAYMSPEQARGAVVDRRADIWAFGVVVYEMLTGRRLFAGETVSDVLAAVLRQEVDLSALPVETPPQLRNLIARCLERDARLRLRDIGEARVLLSRPLAATDAPADRPARRSTVAWQLLPWLLAAGAAIMWLVTSIRPAPVAPADPRTVRATIVGPVAAQGSWFSIDPQDPPVISPDGKMLVLPLETPGGKTMYLRPLNSLEMILVAGGGRRAFFSPDGTAFAFSRPGSVWKMALGDRQPTLVGRLNEVIWDVGFGAWHPDGRLLIAGLSGLWSLPASGGDAVLLLAADAGRQERFTWVRLAPDGRLLLHVVTGDTSRIDALSSAATGRRVVASGFERAWVVDDVLVARQDGQWRATRLDRERLEPTGPSITLADVPDSNENPLGGSMTSVDGSSLVRELVWVSRSGETKPVGIAPGYIRWPRLSPDRTRIVLGVLPPDKVQANTRNDVRITVFDLRTRGRTTLDGFSEPVWSDAGATVITSFGAPPHAGLGVQVSDGSRRMEPLFTLPQDDAWPTDVSGDGRMVVYYGASRAGASGAVDYGDIFILDRQTTDRKQLTIPGNQRGGRLSRDGRWLAFESTGRDRSEIHVRPYPALDADYMVSPDGGDEPSWSHDGKELYFRRGADLVAVKVPAPGSSSGWPAPEVLFTGSFVRDTSGDQSYDVAPDGRFLMLRPAAAGPVQIQVVLDWLAEVRARLASAK
jgi:eukaryotic-like serine/threonine-protein kinase